MEVRMDIPYESCFHSETRLNKAEGLGTLDLVYYHLFEQQENFEKRP
jgi:hypothetical protein